MHILSPAHHHMPSSRRQAVVGSRIEAAVPPAIDLGGREIPGLTASVSMIAAILILIAGFMHGTIDTAIARWIS